VWVGWCRLLFVECLVVEGCFFEVCDVYGVVYLFVVFVLALGLLMSGDDMVGDYV